MRKRYGSKFKAKVAFEAIKNENTITELSNKFEIHRDLVQKWKKIVLEGTLCVSYCRSPKAHFTTSQSRWINLVYQSWNI